jgi:hypothetical protein
VVRHPGLFGHPKLRVTGEHRTIEHRRGSGVGRASEDARDLSEVNERHPQLARRQDLLDLGPTGFLAVQP